MLDCACIRSLRRRNRAPALSHLDQGRTSLDRPLLEHNRGPGKRSFPHGGPPGKSRGCERNAMKNWPRVAFFSDSYHGVDGVATTCRSIVAAARRRKLPFLAIHAAERNSHSHEGSLEILELDRGPFSFPLDL